MESILPQVRSTSELAPGHEGRATPFSQQTVVLTKQAYVQLKWEAHYWRRQHERLLEREAALKAEVEAHQATIRDLTQRLYGAKSEKSATPDSTGASKPASARKRGQQPGSTGHGRTDRSALQVVTEVHDVREAEQHCPVCGDAFVLFHGPEESTIIEVQVQAHRRRIQRLRYKEMCQCAQVPGIVTAPPAPRLIPKSPLGVSVWARVLLDKYLYGRPTHRFCEELRHHGLPLAPGTLTDGLQKMAVLFEPVVQALYTRQMREKLFHGDETRWEVFEEVEGKTSHRWYLWVMRSASVVFYRMAPGRGADVPKAHCAKLQKDLIEVVLVCDRYSAYKCLAKGCDVLILAYGWAHVRRDFLKAARSWPELESWMWTWIDDIRDLYRVNAARLKAWDATVPLDQQSSAFVEHHRELQSHLSRMQTRCEGHLAAKDLHVAKGKVLTSLHNHWGGLTVFSMAA
jgi:transposase